MDLRVLAFGVPAHECIFDWPFPSADELQQKASAGLCADWIANVETGKAKSMPHYEHVVLARQDLSGAQVEALNDNIKEILGQNGGEVGLTETWGLKSLQYRIQRNRKAHFTFMNVTAPAAAIAELERQLRINEDVLRYMTIRVEEHEEGPTAMMRKSDRDDRRGGRGRDR